MEKNLSLAKMLSLLPSVKVLADSLSVTEGEKMGINPCGEIGKNGPLYKLLTSEGIMATYEERKGKLFLMEKMKLHK